MYSSRGNVLSTMHSRTSPISGKRSGIWSVLHPTMVAKWWFASSLRSCGCTWTKYSNQVSSLGISGKPNGQCSGDWVVLIRVPLCFWTPFSLAWDPVLGSLWNRLICGWWSVCGIWPRSAGLLACVPECHSAVYLYTPAPPALQHTATNFTFSLRRPLGGESGVNQSCVGDCCLPHQRAVMVGDWWPGKEKQQKVTFGCLNRLVTFVTVLNGRLSGCLEQYMTQSQML